MNDDTELQALFIERIKEIFDGVKMRDQNGEMKAVNVFAQDTPAPSDEDDTDLIFAPYVIVRLTEGSFEAWNYTRKVETVLVFCLYDDSEMKTGTTRILGMMGKVFDNIAGEPNIGNAHVNLPIEWSVQTDVDTYPFFFGAMKVSFEAAGREINLDALT